MRRKPIITAAILAVFTCSGAFAQQHYNLTLDESIAIAMEKSYSMLTLKEDTEIAAQNLKATLASQRTRIDLELTLPNYSETVEQFNTVNEDGTVNMSYNFIKRLTNYGGLTITQPLPTDGTIYLSTGLNNLNDYNSDKRYVNFNTRIRLRQPIQSLWGYNANRAAVKSARLSYEQANKALKREELNLVYSVSASYYSLLSLQKSAEIALANLERQTEAYEISKNKYDSGLIREVDALQMEVDLAEAQSNYDVAVLNHASAGNAFKELIGIGLHDTVSLNSSMEYEPVVVDADFAVGLAMKNRLEIQERDIQIELQKLTIKQRKSARQPSINLDAYYERTGMSEEALGVRYPTSFGNTFSNFSNRPSNFGVGVNISIPIFNWGQNKANVRASEARMRQYEFSKTETERSVETEVRNLVANLSTTLKRLQLLERNVSVAEKSFDITLKRYSDGDIDSQSLALERNRLNTAYTSHLTAYINYQLALADLMRKTFYDFRTNTSVE